VKHFVSIALLGTLLWANDLSAQDRLYAGAFLEIPVGARAAGMGEAYVATAMDGTAFFWNPAGVALVNRRIVSAMYANYFGGFGQYSFIGYTHQLSDKYGFAVSWIRYSVSGIPENSSFGDTRLFDRGDPDFDFDQFRRGDFSYVDNAIFVSFARLNSLKLNLGWLYSDFIVDIPLGINLKIIKGGTSGISGQGQAINDEIPFDVSNFGIGFDIGTMIMFGMDDLFDLSYLGDFVLGLNLQDATGTAIEWTSLTNDVKPQDVIDANLKWGFSYVQPFDGLQSNLTLSYEHNSRYENDKHYGAEWDYARTLGLRLGYSIFTRPDGSRASYLSYGAGLSYWRIDFDYALISQDFGNVHRVSAAYRF